MSSVSIPQSSSRLPPQYATSQDLATVQKFTQDGVKAQLSRACDYASHNPKVVLDFAVGVIETSVVGGIIGAVGGAIIGGLIGGPPGAVTGACRAGAAGLAVGACVGIHKEKVKVQLSSAYKTWKRTEINDKVFPIYRKFIKESDLPVCPLSLDVIVVPYKCSHGHTFERDELERVFTVSKKAKIICPIGRNPETPKESDYDSWEDCVYDTNYHLDLFKLLKKSSIENPEVQEMVKQYRCTVIDNEIEIGSARIKSEIDAFMQGKDETETRAKIMAHVDRLAKFKVA